MDDLASVEDLHVQSCVIAQFHYVASRRIENPLELVAAILIARAQAGFDLSIYALRQVLFCEPGEVSVKQARAVLRKCPFHGLPGQCVIAVNAFAGQVFDLARAQIINVKLYSGRTLFGQDSQVTNHNRANEDGEKENQWTRESHWPPPTSSSFPVTTPDATVILARPSTGSSTLATPRLIGTSTLAFPPLSTLVKLTTVPSGTELPEQSLMGSVSIRKPFFALLDLIRRVQASAAICCTTRTSLAWPISAPSLAAPSFLAELSRTHATPFSEFFVAETALPSFGRTLNFTGSGFSTMLWKLSRTTATALMRFGLSTGTRDGCTRKLKRFGAAGFTTKLAELHPSDAHKMAV